MDSAHPTMATKVVDKWIKKGIDKPIAKTASKTRVNITAAIELSSMKVVSCQPDDRNEQTTINFFDQLKAVYFQAPQSPIILDQSSYHTSNRVKAVAKEKKIQLHYLPPYSPHLNSIERLWKVMNEETRDHVFFSSAKEFREAIRHFFDVKLPKMAGSLRSRMNNNFQTIKPVPSG